VTCANSWKTTNRAGRATGESLPLPLTAEVHKLMTVNRDAARRAAWQEFTADFEEAFGWIAIADAEVRRAQGRHPGQADLVYHAWPILIRPYWLPSVGFIYAGHIRELLDRVAAGQDTRPGTAAEIAAGLARILNLKFPHALAGLYHRMWVAAFPDNLLYEGQDRAAAWYEQDAGSEMDVHEAELRRRLRQPRRCLPDDITCDGGHGDCRFATVPVNSRSPAVG
jgi:hypothetical protein